MHYYVELFCIFNQNRIVRRFVCYSRPTYQSHPHFYKGFVWKAIQNEYLEHLKPIIYKRGTFVMNTSSTQNK